jgi:hypothetical protein
MTLYTWNTGDPATDSNLRKLEGGSRWRIGSDAEQVHQLLLLCIAVEKMLPKAVRRHFDLPNLFTGESHFTLGQAYRDRLVSEITTALQRGLEAVEADPTLRRDGGADLSDRPRTKGEAIKEAIRAFSKAEDARALSALRQAVYGTHLTGRVEKISELMNRKRSYGNQSPRLAMLGELGRLDIEASHCHHIPDVGF